MLPALHVALVTVALITAGCAHPGPASPAADHLSAHATTNPPADEVPPLLESSFEPRPAPPAPPQETYSVTVSRLPVEDLLFALARDARLDLDLHPGLAGEVTLNAIDQTLPQLLERISGQVALRYELEGRHLVVMPDQPFFRHYAIDYLNLSRSVSATVATNTQISTSTAALESKQEAAGGNVSSTRIENLTRNRFWETIERNIQDILRETDEPLAPAPLAPIPPLAAGEGETHPRRSPARGRPATAAQAEPPGADAATPPPTMPAAAAVIVNRESGIVSVLANARQQRKIAEFIEAVTTAARRQVLVEATIVEVSLSDGYQQGIDWSRLGAKG